MKKLKLTFILLAMSLIVLSGCSLPGLGDGDGKDSCLLYTSPSPRD